MRIITLARKGLVYQSGLMPKAASRNRLISPKFWLNKPLNTRMEMNAGIA
jgi:hypothetical protein